MQTVTGSFTCDECGKTVTFDRIASYEITRNMGGEPLHTFTQRLCSYCASGAQITANRMECVGWNIRRIA